MDDRFHENLKVKRAWKGSPSSVGLFTMSVTHSAGNLLDGFVPLEFVESLFRRDRDQDAAVAALVDNGLWVEVEGGWDIPAFLEFNESRAETEAKRERNSKNGRRGGKARAKRVAGESPSESLSDGQASSQPFASQPAKPDPTRPDPTRPVSPNGETTDREVVVVPPTLREPVEVEKACDVLAAAGAHIHDRSIVTGLAKAHADVDLVEAAIRAANWGRNKTVKHPFALLRQFVEDDDAPKRGEVPKTKGRHLSPVDHYAAMADPEEAA
jgi:hypothetical protein